MVLILCVSAPTATRLLSGEGTGPLEFSEPRYCALMQEDAALGASVVSVLASHKKGAEVRYSITGGNKDGLFTIDQRSGVITLAAPLDFEIHDKGSGPSTRTTLYWTGNNGTPELTSFIRHRVSLGQSEGRAG
ncbi:hypothetical protein Pmani_035808 [Petrolisthes manimaculis]|uniref:Cadherin domain-containing protein n=1 Tax=Petrolisthes manimaculis TaxID=1843537 RepID=A0AAE1NKW6_9EUCA|nr:hypothetical protein Pmani_035808 [Petrolisthes manimaculis]